MIDLKFKAIKKELNRTKKVRTIWARTLELNTKFKAIHDYTDTSYILGSENLVNKMLAVRKIEVGKL